MANNLNVRRSLRAIVLPRLEELESKISAMQSQLDRIEQSFEVLSQSLASGQANSST
jgi:hypothetical protein